MTTKRSLLEIKAEVGDKTFQVWENYAEAKKIVFGRDERWKGIGNDYVECEIRRIYESYKRMQEMFGVTK